MEWLRNNPTGQRCGCVLAPQNEVTPRETPQTHGRPIPPGMPARRGVSAPAFHVETGDALDFYASWPTPRVIVSDGAYGVRGFHGDPPTPAGLPDWYRPHIEAWSQHAHPSTVLWFWNTEIGWATVHPLLEANGWEYVQTVTWDKGIGHVAGNVNGATIRRFPTVTEVCTFYQRRLAIPTEDGDMSAQDWLRYEWRRAGLALNRANEACGVRNAATRKYLTADWMWYWPPGDMVVRLAAYATQHGEPTGRPYFSVNGRRSVTATEWDALRYRWNHQHGLTNVWSRPALRDSERIKGGLERSAPRTHNPSTQSATHFNQKPLDLMRRILGATAEPRDVVWEPFGGTASAAVAAVELGAVPYVAEVSERITRIAAERLANTASVTKGGQ